MLATNASAVVLKRKKSITTILLAINCKYCLKKTKKRKFKTTVSTLQTGREEAVPSRDTGGAACARSEGGGGAGCAAGWGMNDRAPVGTGKRVGKQKVVRTALVLWGCGYAWRMT